MQNAEAAEGDAEDAQKGSKGSFTTGAQRSQRQGEDPAMLPSATRPRQTLRRLSRWLLATVLLGQAGYGAVVFLGLVGMSIQGGEYRTTSAGSEIVTDLVNSGQLVLPDEENAELRLVWRIADAAQQEAALYEIPAVRSALLMVGLGIAGLILLLLQRDKPFLDKAPNG